jgi:hypothetical protein
MIVTVLEIVISTTAHVNVCRIERGRHVKSFVAQPSTTSVCRVMKRSACDVPPDII